MKERPLRTTVIGSYPFPGWLEFATQNLDRFGPDDREELIDDAVAVALQDQLAAGVDVVTDGEIRPGWTWGTGDGPYPLLVQPESVGTIEC